MSEYQNLVPNPKPASLDGWIARNLNGLTLYEQSLRLENTVTRGCVDSFVALTPGDWVLVAKLERVLTETAWPENNSAVTVIPSSADGSSSQGVPVNSAYKGLGWYEVPFTVPQSTIPTSRIRLWAATGTSTNVNVTRWKNIMVCTKQDWQHLRDERVQWFDGDGIIRVS